MSLDATSTASAEGDQLQVLRATAVLAAYDVVQHVKQRGVKLAALRLRPPPVTKRQLIRDYGRSQYRVGKAPESARESEARWQMRRWSTQTSSSTRRRSSNYVEGVSLLPREIYDAVRPECIHRLQIVDLRGMQLGDKGLVQVCDVLIDAPIHTLVMSDNGITDKGVAIFAKYARYFNCLKTLMLNANQVTSQGIAMLLDKDLHNKNIERLNVQQNQLCSMTCHWLGQYFSNHDHSLQNLRTLNLGGKSRHVFIGDSGVTLLVAGITRPVVYPLAELSIADCGLTVLGAKAIATLLLVSDSLRCLNVSGNDLGAEGLAVIEAALQANSSLRLIEIRTCGIDEADGARVRLLAASERPPLSWKQRRHLAGVAIALVEHVMFFRTKHDRYFGFESVEVDDRFDAVQAAKVRLAVDAFEVHEVPVMTARSGRQQRHRQKHVRAEVWRNSSLYRLTTTTTTATPLVRNAAQRIEAKLSTADCMANTVQDLCHTRQLRKVHDIVVYATEIDSALGTELGAAMHNYDRCQQAVDNWLIYNVDEHAASDLAQVTEQVEHVIDELSTHVLEVVLLLQDLVQYLLYRDTLHAPFCQHLTAAAVIVEQVLNKSVIRRPKSRATPRTPQQKQRALA